MYINEYIKMMSLDHLTLLFYAPPISPGMVHFNIESNSDH